MTNGNWADSSPLLCCLLAPPPQCFIWCWSCSGLSVESWFTDCLPTAWLQSVHSVKRWGWGRWELESLLCPVLYAGTPFPSFFGNPDDTCGVVWMEKENSLLPPSCGRARALLPVLMPASGRGELFSLLGWQGVKSVLWSIPFFPPLSAVPLSKLTFPVKIRDP